ncbi:MAG: DUF1800 domain-containing protein [Campylobacteraceae bacterium]|nr:DUF1800 domain-containing protein [Campylobacteraceae bacterium]
MKILFLILISFNLLFSLSLEESKHLLNRTSFGYTKADLKLFQTFSKKEAVSHLIENAQLADTIKIPSNIYEVSRRPNNIKTLSRGEQQKLRRARNQKAKEIQAWWYKMMLIPEYAFREKMTLFWHNHFVSEYRVVKDPNFMFQQNMLYREYSLGNFDTFVHKSSKDLAMLIYLDSNSNKKSHPNENYARELLELFTLGEGHYTEEDVKEAARAFTGWRVNRKNMLFRKSKKFHDYSEKTFQGEQGYFDGEDIIDIVLKNDQTSLFIVSKLYKEFISTTINEKLVNQIALEFRTSKYEISKAVRLILLSDDFWNNKANLIKSPVELIVSLSKNLDLDLSDKNFKFIIKTAKNLGQELFNPPNVKGWEGGETWIDSSSILSRQEFIKRVIQKKMNKKSLKKLNIKNYEDFQSYFYPFNFNKKVNFVVNKKNYIQLLSESVYQLK